MALKFGVLVFNQGHDQLLGAQTFGNGTSIGVVTNKFTNIITRNRRHFFIAAARQQGNQHLYQVKVTVGSFHHAGIFLEKGLRVARAPLQVARFNLVLVHFPTAQFLVIVVQLFVQQCHVFDEIRIGKLSVTQMINGLHEAAGNHFGRKGRSINGSASVAGGRFIFIGYHRGQIDQTRQCHAHHLFTRGHRYQIHQGRNGQRILGKIGPNGGRSVQFVGQNPHAKGDFVQLLHRGLAHLFLVRGGHILGLGTHAQLAGHVLDATRLAKQISRFRSVHENLERWSANGHQGSRSILELRHDPSGNGFQGFNGRCVLNGSGLAAIHRHAGGALAGAGSDENLCEASGSYFLRKHIALSSLVEASQQGLPLIHQNTLLSDIKDTGNCDSLDSFLKSGENFQKLGQCIMSHNAKRIRLEQLKGTLLGHDRGRLARDLGHITGAGSGRIGFGQQLE
mmetsp:Transcript_7668/g.21333  ORF Transcript_7668/g.21333 Transcript_7668/m.21333 type:complete len:451 (+) Transcript_7668:693-2045(+)